MRKFVVVFVAEVDAMPRCCQAWRVYFSPTCSSFFISSLSGRLFSCLSSCFFFSLFWLGLLPCRFFLLLLLFFSSSLVFAVIGNLIPFPSFPYSPFLLHSFPVKSGFRVHSRRSFEKAMLAAQAFLSSRVLSLFVFVGAQRCGNRTPALTPILPPPFLSPPPALPHPFLSPRPHFENVFHFQSHHY